jgi:hypothetical protein
MRLAELTTSPLAFIFKNLPLSSFLSHFLMVLLSSQAECTSSLILPPSLPPPPPPPPSIRRILLWESPSSPFSYAAAAAVEDGRQRQRLSTTLCHRYQATFVFQANLAHTVA